MQSRATSLAAVASTLLTRPESTSGTWDLPKRACVPTAAREGGLVPPCPRGMAGRLGEPVLCKRPHWFCPLSFHGAQIPAQSVLLLFSSRVFFLPGMPAESAANAVAPRLISPDEFCWWQRPREEGPRAPFVPENSLEQCVAHSSSPWTLQRGICPLKIGLFLGGKPQSQFGSNPFKRNQLLAR